MSNIIRSLIQAFSSNASEEVKEYLQTESMDKGPQLFTDIIIDSSTGMIPYIGQHILNFRTKQAMVNQNVFLKEIGKRLHVLEEAIKNEEAEYQEKIDKIYLIGSDSAARCMQEDKVKYFANGVLNSIDNDFSYDMSILYFSILDKITILEIEVLKNLNIPFDKRNTDFKRRIIKTFNITEEGYYAAKGNLLRVGLLESNTENYMQHDLDEIIKALLDAQDDINIIIKFLNNKSKNLRVSGNKRLKHKTKDTVKISKLGINFINHFIK